MPQAIPAITAGFAALATALGTTSLGLGIGLLATAGSVGLNYYQQQKAADAAKRARKRGQEVQQNITQGTMPRYNVLGKAKVNGVLAFYDAANGYLCIANILADDIIDGVDAYYLNEKAVLLDSAGYVTSPPFYFKGAKFARLELHYGYTDQATSAILLQRFPGIVTAQHTLNGIAYMVAEFAAAKSEYFQAIYNSQIPEVGALVRGVLVYDPRDPAQDTEKADTWKTTTNPALLLLYYFTAINGYGISRARFDLDSFARVADFCDETLETATKGQRKRYEMGGVYFYDTDPADIIGDILRTFDGQIYVNSDGLFALSCEELEEPEITIAEDMVLEISVAGVPGALYEYSTIKTRFTSEDHGWNESGEEADPWVDEDIKATIGRDIPYSYDLPYVFRHDQARRLMKRQLYRLNPEWSIDVVLDFNGLELFGERVCRFVYPPLGIDGTFRIEAVAPDDQDGLGKITAKLTSIDPAAFEWDRSEEGTPPAIPPATSDDGSPQTPTGLSVLVGDNGATVQALLTWSANTAGHVQHADWRDVTGGGSYVALGVTNDDFSWLLTGLTLGNDYEFRVWLTDSSYGETSKASVTFTATAAVGTTGALGSFSASGGTLSVNVQAVQSANATAAFVQFSIVTTGAGASWASPTVVNARANGSATETITKTAGVYDVYARSQGINGDTGAVLGPQTVTVTSGYSGSGSSGSDSGLGGSGKNDNSPTGGSGRTSESPSQQGGIY